MVQRIDPDSNRFRQIVRGKIKQNLRKYISHGELIGKKGKDIVSIPLPQIELPRFRYGSEQKGGVGQGEGEAGTPISLEPGQGLGAGQHPGDHILEVDVTLEDLAEILGEELELPRIEPRGERMAETAKDRYTGIRRVGPESLRHFKRTFRQALKRQVISGVYDPEHPVIVPLPEDARYRSWKSRSLPEASAVIIYMMDVSGSMGHEQKEIVRIESFWIDTWLRSQYRQMDTRFIIHDAVAREVDRETFFHVRESGGTRISSAYQLSREIIESDYDPAQWNIYPFHFSDGDNWGGEDTAVCLRLLEEFFFETCNVFCYGQVKSAYGSGQFIKDLKERFPDRERLLLSEINCRDDIVRSIKSFLGKGR
ncbi:MAG: DUF444 family protein [Planctomycetes bacterium]|nr:DUF444 family protein [Planctomycetota bacterium]